MTRASGNAFLILLTTGGLFAQPGMRPPKFEAVSIKPSGADSGAVSTSVSPGGTLIARNMTLRALVALAYNLNKYEIAGGPGWVDSRGYDIVAKPKSGFKHRTPVVTAHAVDDDAGLLQLRLQALLADRFKLSV